MCYGRYKQINILQVDEKADQSTRYTKYRKFKDEVEKAMAIAEARDVAIIALASEEDWKAAAWMLEHRFSEHWNPKYNKENHEELDFTPDDGIIDRALIRQAMAIVTKKRLEI